MDKPLPCPFCGGDPLLEENANAYEPYFCLGCNNADCAGHRVFDAWSLEFRDESIAKWNQRSRQPEGVNRNDVIKECAKACGSFLRPNGPHTLEYATACADLMDALLALSKPQEQR